MNFNFIKLTLILFFVAYIFQSYSINKLSNQTHQTTQELLRIIAK